MEHLLSDPRNILAGGRGERIGRAWESALESAHRAYYDHGLAWVMKLPVPTVYVGEGRRRVVARQNWDYSGVFGPNAGPIGHEGLYHGLAIAMEAKANDKPKTSMRVVDSTKTSGLSLHQLGALHMAYMDWGVVSVVVWRNGPDVLVLLPDDLVKAWDLIENGDRKSIPVSMFTECDVCPYPEHPPIHDWLFPVRCWLEREGIPSSGSSKRRAYEMVQYRLDISRKIVKIRDPGAEGGWREVRANVVDRAILDLLARESESPDQFERVIGEVDTANED